MADDSDCWQARPARIAAADVAGEDADFLASLPAGDYALPGNDNLDSDGGFGSPSAAATLLAAPADPGVAA